MASAPEIALPTTLPMSGEVCAPDVVVIGDGLGGLVCAHQLLAAGLVPLVVPAPEPGREQLRAIRHRGVSIPVFPHVIEARDTATLALLHALGLGPGVRFADLRREERLAPQIRRHTRLRARLASLRLRGPRSGGGLIRLHERGALEWLRAGSRPEELEQILRPRVESWLGELDDAVPADRARWALRRAAEPGGFRAGHVRGGLPTLAAALRARIARRGGVFWDEPGLPPEIRLRSWGVEVRGRTRAAARAAISTLPEAELRVLLGQTRPGPRAHRRQSLTSVCVIARRGELAAEELRIVDPGARFFACFQADRLLPQSEIGDLRVFYLLRRVAPGLPREADEVVAKQALDALGGWAADFEPSDAVQSVVTTAFESEYVPRVGDPRGDFAPRMEQGPLFLSSCEQSYPRPPGLESRVLMSREAVSRVRRELG